MHSLRYSCMHLLDPELHPTLNYNLSVTHKCMDNLIFILLNLFLSIIKCAKYTVLYVIQINFFY